MAGWPQLQLQPQSHPQPQLQPQLPGSHGTRRTAGGTPAQVWVGLGVGAREGLCVVAPGEGSPGEPLKTLMLGGGESGGDWQVVGGRGYGWQGEVGGR